MRSAPAQSSVQTPQDVSPPSSGTSAEENGQAILPKEADPSSVISSCATAAGAPVYNWVEVTQDFIAATKELELGELLHDDLFGLFEAMSAIEMMDPKMDAGMRCNRQAKKPYSFQSALETGHVRLDGLTKGEQIGIIDQTFACLVTWLEGHSLAQTVFTNLYLHQPFEIRQPLIKAFSVTMLKLIDVIKELTARGGVYEEEDFQPVSYNFKLASEVNEMRGAGMLKEVEDDLQRVIRGTRARPGENRTKSVLKEHEECNALYSRVRFTRHLYLALVALLRRDSTEAYRLLSTAKEQTTSMVTSIDLGSEGKEDNLVGFERLANQRLLPPTFPRYTEIKSRCEGIQYLRGLVDRLLQATAVTSITTFHSALEFFIDFSTFKPCVLSRSALQILYTPLSSQFPFTNANAQQQPSTVSSPLPPPTSLTQFSDLLKDACRSFIAPPALIMLKTPPFNAKQLRECIDTFFVQCCRPMTLLLQTFGHNRARQRDKLVALVEEFATVQEEADKLDNMLNAVTTHGADGSRPQMLFFSTWLLYHVLRIMVRYILSGFELELYSLHEYPYLYWYLYELLYPWLTTCLHRADTYLQEREQSQETQRMAGKNKKKVKSSAKKGKGTGLPRPYAREITLYQGYGCICAGYFKLLVGLKKEHKILIPSPTFDNESVRYEHRFAPFANLLTPPLMPYGQYREIYDHALAADDLFTAAGRDFARARQILEAAAAASSPAGGGEMATSSASEATMLASVAKNNFVAACILARDHSRKVDFDFGPHNTFPSVRLV